MNFRRTAMVDVVLSDTPIAAGDKVVFFHVSANRDEDVFRDPDTFDLTRDPNPHIGFGGGGPHFCLGANLARMEIRVMFEHLLDRMPDIRPEWRDATPPVAVHQRGEAPSCRLLAFGPRRRLRRTSSDQASWRGAHPMH